MQRTTEIAVAKALLSLESEKSAFLDDGVAESPVHAYTDPERFRLESDRIFRRTPQPAVHSSELPEPGSFVRRSIAGLPLLFTRDADGLAHAFLNVCRHRGTRLVDDERGCKQRFSCPYHAWTWNNRGDLIGVPHEKQGFPGLERDKTALVRVGSVETHGWVWVQPDSDEAPDVEDFLEGLAGDFDWFESGDHVVVHSDEQLINANWKILVEGGIEAYHFRVAHRDTIAPFFFDNLSSYEAFGPHLRSVLARRSLAELRDQPEDQWRLRDHSQVLYSLFPVNQLLVQADHFVWVQSEPLSASQTRLRLSTLAPRDRLDTDDDRLHWQKNHAITRTTLTEDFVIGESIQSGLNSGANETLTFGRFEGALARFNESVMDRL